MSFFGGGGGGAAPAPPPPPPPPPNPPTYASAAFTPPRTGAGLPQGILQGSILTSPLGAANAGATQRKQLFGQ